MFLLISIAILFTAYSILILYYTNAWNTIPEYVPANKNTEVKISVIIPARNEEENITPLLTSLLGQSYPKDNFEIIVIDDHSTDSTVEKVTAFPEVRLIKLRFDELNSYKKKAIEQGVKAAKGDLIVTTDADCIPPPDWLSTIASYKQDRNSAFIAAPVSINCNNSIVQIFQAMDFMVLQGITGAAVYKKSLSMSNGANMAYERNAFIQADGFMGIDNIASGDDMLLMHKIVKLHPNRIHYLKSKQAIVSTAAVKTWKEFFNQRIRWASKATYFNDKRIFSVLSLVYLFNFSCLVLFAAGFFNPWYFLWFAVLLIAKTLVELPFFISVARFFQKEWAVKMFPLFQPLHILYTIISGLFGQFGKYYWKGRRVK